MRFTQSAPVLAVADTTRPILLIGFIVGLFAIAGLGVFLGRKHVAAQNARALSDDTGLDKGAVKGGDGTFSTDWLAEAREDVDDTPRQSWADVLSLQGVGEAAETGPSPFGAQVSDEASVSSGAATPDYAASSYEAPAYPVEAPSYPTAPDYEAPAYPAAPAYTEPAYTEPAAPAYEAPTYPVEAPAYPSEPVYEAPTDPVPPVYATPVYAEPVYAEPAAAEPVYAEPAAAEPVIPVYAEPVEPAYPEPEPAVPAPLPVAAAPGEEYATFFGATPPPPPPPPVEPFNIWATDTDER